MRFDYCNSLSKQSSCITRLFPDSELIIGPNLQIVKRFVECVQAPPLGCRTPIAPDADDDDEDDRTVRCAS